MDANTVNPLETHHFPKTASYTLARFVLISPPASIYSNNISTILYNITSRCSRCPVSPFVQTRTTDSADLRYLKNAIPISVRKPCDILRTIRQRDNQLASLTTRDYNTLYTEVNKEHVAKCHILGMVVVDLMLFVLP